MIQTLSVGRITLRVKDLKSTSKFYQEALGLELRSQGADFQTLGSRESDLVKLVSTPDLEPAGPRSPGLFHLAILLPTRKDLGAWFRHFQQVPVEFQRLFEGPGDHGVSEALYLHDPEGNGIEIYADRPESEWPRDAKGNIEMYTRAVDLSNLLKEAEQHPWNGLPDGTRMGHVHLKVGNLAAAHQFYVEKLGLDLIFDFGGSAKFVSKNGYHHHIGLNTWQSRGSQPAKQHQLGLADSELIIQLEQQIGTTLTDALSEFAKALTSKGVTIVEEDSEFLTILDPDHLQLTLRLQNS